MTSEPDDVWVADDCRWVNLSRLLAELPEDRRRVLLDAVQVRRRVSLAHRAIQVLRRCVSQKRDETGKVSDVLLGGVSHGG